MPTIPNLTPDLEAQNAATYADFPLQTHHHLGLIRYKALNVYRRLFTLAFTTNAIALTILLARNGRATTPLDLLNAFAINLAICGLSRHPLITNALFLLTGSIPRSAPLRLRRIACKIFHYGGIHSGTGVASFLWYIAFAALYTIQFTPTPISTTILTLTYLILLLLLTTITVAYPTLRAKHHNHFSLIHRFSSWLILLLLWPLLLLLSSQQPPIPAFLVNLPAFWILTLLTAATIHPWLSLRRIKVTPEPLSPHAIRLHFTHTSAHFGQVISLAKHPLKDWHSFATFVDKHDTPESKFSVLVSNAGDWTHATIAQPPAYLWKRGIPVYTFGYAMGMFNKIIIVTTGSGIGPCLSFIGDDNPPLMRVVWQTRAPVETYGARTMALVRRMDEDAVILDTTSSGRRVDMVPVVLRLWREFGAEAVCVVSNAVSTRSIVYELEMRGIPAFGPIFDS